MYAAKHHDVPNIIGLAPRYDWRIEQNQGILDLLPQIQETGSVEYSTKTHTYTITQEMIADRTRLVLDTTCEQVQSDVYLVYGT